MLLSQACLKWYRCMSRMWFMKPFCSKSVRTCTEALGYYKKVISAHEEIFGDQLNAFAAILKFKV